MDKVSMLHFNVSFLRYQAKCVIRSYLTFDDVINFEIFLESTSIAMAEREKKRGRGKYKNLNIFRTKRDF